MAKSKVTPLRKRTMGLSELQLRTLDVLRQVQHHLRTPAYDPGAITDEEFIDQVIEPLATDIYQDRQVLKMLRQSKKK